MPGLPVPDHLLKFAQVYVYASVMPSSHLILWHPFLLLPSVFPSVRDFSNKSSVQIKWPNYWRFSFSIIPSSENIQGWYPLRLTGLISLLSKGLSGVFSSTSSKAPNFWHPAFFMVQFSQLYMTIGKIIALTVQTFVGRVISLLFTTLSRFFIAFLLRSNHLLISCLQSLSAVILESKRKSVNPSSFPLLFAI